MKELTDLIRVNKIGLCSVLETHVARHNVKSVFNKMFRRWPWMSDSEHCMKGCRIVIGWDPNQYDVMEMFTTDQVIHCLVKQISSGDHFFV